MKYLGGKSRLAKEIAGIIAPRGEWWEPFCGGLSVSVQLAKYGPGVVSDANEALINLYKAVAAGWVPPNSATLSDHARAKNLPNSDPMKAFMGVGCSFRGDWFGGFTPKRTCTVKTGPSKGQVQTQNPARGAREALLRDLPKLAACSIHHLSFFDVDPSTAPAPECIYADPPYQGTTGYSGAGAFDHTKFWGYCGIWAARGVRVFVSELSCPTSAEVVWEKAHVHRIAGTQSSARTERLFRVQAPSVARCA